ncbi:hypothetical protein M501DRAFT_909623, partial [Patellaria atrata CBS 101060]
MANQFYIPLPPQTPHGKQAVRRPPVTPSTITPPSISRHNSSVAVRQVTGVKSPDQATALLAKVASHPTTRRGTPVSSPLPSPTEQPTESHRTLQQEPSASDRLDVSRYWTAHAQQDGYISFPDFEKFHQNCGPQERRERS